MNSTLKILVPLVLLVGGVFVLTYFTQYTPTDDADKGGPEVVTAKKPLQFFSSRRAWLPREIYDKALSMGDTPPGTLADVAFYGFYEPAADPYSATFWFKNESPGPVKMQLKAVSCTTCSGGRVAPIPNDVAKQILQMTAVTALPQGFVSGLPAGMVGPAANLASERLTWQYHKYDKAPIDIVYEVPAAPSPSADKWISEQWAILELQFQAKPTPGLHGLQADFITQLQGSPDSFEEKFGLGYVTSPPFEMDKLAIDAGELTDGSSSQTHDVLVYSATRTNLADLTIAVQMPLGVDGEPGPFVAAGKPVPVPESRYLELMKLGSEAKKGPVRFRSAFIVPITISPKVGDAKMDIGRLERSVNFRLGSEVQTVRVTGSMRGPIYLAGSKEIGFGNFHYVDEQSVVVKVESERADLELRIVPELTQPKALKLDLKREPNIGDRGLYSLKATLPGREQLGEIKDGVVVLEAKGPNPLRLRIPVTGRGR